MKKAFTTGMTLVVVLFCIPLISHAERIKDLSVTIKVQENAEVLVTENISYDFEGANRHGIYRDIPTHNSDGSWLRIKDISVTDTTGANYPIMVTNNTQGTHIRIGDSEKLITGTKEYLISYTVKNALVSFPRYDELYWNGVGNGWNVSIDHASLAVMVPGESDNIVQVSCYRGQAGMIAKCTPGFTASHPFLSETTIVPGFGITIALGIKKEIVSGITRIGGQTNVEKASFSIPTPVNQQLIKIIVGLLTGIILAWTAWYWVKNRDPKPKNPLIAEYEPLSDLPPIVLGTLVDKKTGIEDVTAQILFAANKGYLFIERLEEKQFVLFKNVDYRFTVTSNPIDPSELDKKLLDMLFNDSRASVGTTVLMSELKQSGERIKSCIDTFKIISSQILVDQGYFEKVIDSEKVIVHEVFKVTFRVAILALGFIALHMSQVLGNSIFILFPPIILAVILFFRTTSRCTQSGVEAAQQVKGFKLFLTVTDQERFTFHNAPEKNPAQFMEYLPYAVALGVEKQWAKQFEGILLPQPSWYQSNNATTFTAISFISEFHGLSNSFEMSATPASSGSGGGGFSGGGSGGGGGGSW